MMLRLAGVWCTGAVAVDGFFRPTTPRNLRPSLPAATEAEFTQASRRLPVAPGPVFAPGPPDGGSGGVGAMIGPSRISRFCAHLTRR